MADVRVRFYVQVTDFNGDTALASYTGRASDTIGDTDLNALTTATGAWATAVAQATNGKVTRQSFEVLVDEAQFIIGTSPPSDNKYPSVTDGARFQFANAQGERTSVTIPAPLEALFGVGSMVVDPTQANSAAVITYITANAEDISGNLMNLYKGGIKVGKRARRRRSALRP